MPRRSKPDPVCPYCGAAAVFMAASDHVYRQDYGPIWQCQPCQAWVGCHPDGSPLGRLANKALRQAKIAAHAALEPLIDIKMKRDKVSKNRARSAAYRWLATELGISLAGCHIGMFNETLCQRVIDICTKARKPRDGRGSLPAG